MTSDSDEVTGFQDKPPPDSPAAGDGTLAGRTIGRFEILELLGRGGFGEVYRARDTSLNRIVAVKAIPEVFAHDPQRRERFRREAIAASALNHPNICTIFDLASAGDQHFIVMEYVDGKTLHQALSKGPLTLAQALPIALQIAAALTEAHRRGILHRDIKANNILLTPGNTVKVLDFGLAKWIAQEGSDEPADAMARKLTLDGTTIGTLPYMSPEQLLGKPLDGRSDIFSFGVLLSEMVTGRMPFAGSNAVSIADAILHKQPDLSAAPPELLPILRHMLARSPEDRYANADDVARDLNSALGKASATAVPPAPAVRRLFVPAAVAILLLAGVGAWLFVERSRARWARQDAIPQIGRLIVRDRFAEAVALTRRAEKILGADPALTGLWPQMSIEVSVETTPTGADVFFKSYETPEAPWQRLGRSPLAKAVIPRGFYRWRFDKPGFDSSDRIWPRWAAQLVTQSGTLTASLYAKGSVPPEMIRVPAGRWALNIPGFEQLDAAPLDDYLIDRYEVTNEAFKKFVDAGGYRRPEFWKEPFVRGGREVPRPEAMTAFRDTSAQPGPSTWELGTFPKGQERFPVSGVSWYEAAAYAAFAGKSLPTVYHWNRAAETTTSALVSPFSNFSGRGPAAVASTPGMNAFGTYDMAGNVKEWCANEAEPGKRYILGGGWNEPIYMFIDEDAQSAWDRSPSFGFRCVRYLSSGGAGEVASRKIEIALRDYSKEKPVSEELFRAYRSLYSYDKTPLNAVVESPAETTDDWIRQRVTFDAAYNGERMAAYLYLPRNASPPYQTVVYFPGSNAIVTDKFNDVFMRYADLVPKSGRALLFPVYKSTFERRDAFKSDIPTPTTSYRDHVVAWAKDLGRAVDYAATRSDLDTTRLAFMGLSFGASRGVIAATMESRFKTAILLSGGLKFQRALPEADAINFVSRLKIPVLMLNGRFDHFFPVETSQKPLFRLLGSPEKDKRYVVYETGHALQRGDVIKESLEWLDRYLGPVAPLR